MNRASLVLAYGLLAATAFAFACVELALSAAAPSPLPGWMAVIVPAVAVVYFGAGIAAALRRPANRMGPLMIFGGLVWLIAGLVNTGRAPLVAAGLIVQTVPLAIVVHLLHAFASGRIRGRASLATVAAGYFVCTAMQAPQFLFGGGPEGPATVLQVAYEPRVAEIAQWAQWAAGSVVMVTTAAILWQRWRAVAPARRHGVAPVLGYGIFAVLSVPVSGHFISELSVSDPWLPWAITAQLAAVAAVPLAFLATMLGGGFGRTLAIDELPARIAAGDGGRPSVTEALAATLGDPTLEFGLWLPARGAFVDAAGEPVAVPPERPGRVAVEVAGDDAEPLGAIVYDATLIGDRGLVEAAARVVALALDRQRLADDLRTRAVTARDDERRRLARDLHDGLQTRLLLLAMSANELREGPAAGAADRERLAQLERGLAGAVEELRTFAHGILPAVLVERGIYAAVDELAGSYPGVVERQIDLGAERPPAAVETTAYFVLSEALANALKHAGAERVRIGLARANGTLTIEVEDDGRGGAAPRGGIRDRVDALGGRIEVRSPPGGGTVLRAELPCGS
ncbi:MAG: sensor histidine kinase [Actinobacteria bacterium]|nr:sensor histidine kinase [Actinomycetota bacterium]